MTAPEYLSWIKSHNPRLFERGQSTLKIKVESLEQIIKNAFEKGRAQGMIDGANLHPGARPNPFDSIFGKLP